MRAGFAVLSDHHRARLADGALLAKAPRLPWSTLLWRTYAADVLACPRCHGRARVIAAIQDPAEAARFLAAISLFNLKGAASLASTAPALPLLAWRVRRAFTPSEVLVGVDGLTLSAPGVSRVLPIASLESAESTRNAQATRCSSSSAGRMDAPRTSSSGTPRVPNRSTRW